MENIKIKIPVASGEEKNDIEEENTKKFNCIYNALFLKDNSL